MLQLQTPRPARALAPALAFTLCLVPLPGTPDVSYTQTSPPARSSVRARPETPVAVPDPHRARAFAAFLAALSMSGAARGR